MAGRHGVAHVVVDSVDTVLGEELRTPARVADGHCAISELHSGSWGHDAVTPHTELQSLVWVPNGKGWPDRGAIPAELDGVGAGLGSARPSHPLDRAAHHHRLARRTPVLDVPQLFVR